MFLKTLRIRNFMPFKGWHQIDFPDSDTKNVVIVFGDNMRGKTSLLNAIRWAFYQNALDRYGEKIPLQKLVNSDAAGEDEWDLEVQVSFDHDNKQYEISSRAEKRRGVGTPNRPEDFVVATDLQINGEVVRGDRVAHEINRVVPEQISRFFLFDGELLQEYESLLADDGDQGKRIKEAIEQALGVPTLISGKNELRALRKPYDRQWQQDLKKNQEVKSFMEELSALTKRSEDLEEAKAKLQDQLSSAKHQYQELQQQVNAAEARYKQKAELDQYVSSRTKVSQQIEQIELRKLESVRDAWLDVLRPDLERQTRDLRSQAAADALVLAEIAKAPHLREMAQSSLDSGVCSLCQSELSTESRRILLGVHGSGETAGEIDRVATRFAESNQLANRLDGVRYPQAKKRIAELDATAMDLSLEETRLASEIDRLRDELQGFDSDETNRVRRAAENANAAIRTLEAKFSQVDEELEKINTKQQSLRLVINQNESAKNQRSGKIVDLISTAEGIFASAVGMMRDDLRMDIQEKATSAFKQLTTDTSYKGLRINQNYGLTIVDEKDRDVSLRSAGAEQIVALSLIDGLNQTGRSTGPVIMDTPFGRLDPRHRSRVLQYLPKSANQVVLFVHEGEVDPERDLMQINSKIGAVFALERVSSSQTKVVRK